jgi:hypothetical protein
LQIEELKGQLFIMEKEMKSMVSVFESELQKKQIAKEKD